MSDELCKWSEIELTKEEEADVMQLAAVGVTPRLIAVAMEFDAERIEKFVAQAAIAGSHVHQLLEVGAAIGVATPQKKLQELATAGNIEAIKTLQEIRQENNFRTLLMNMDDDEL